MMTGLDLVRCEERSARLRSALQKIVDSLSGSSTLRAIAISALDEDDRVSSLRKWAGEGRDSAGDD